jgi:hypothetical protein
MKDNQHYFKIEGLWENKMQKIIYDYLINSGPIDLIRATDPKDTKLLDRRQGYHTIQGHTKKSMLFDVLGYVDKDAEKIYASYNKKLDKQGRLVAHIENTIQNVDIYNGLYDI